jgi:uncharacterized coiled-coil protein SlyX
MNDREAFEKWYWDKWEGCPVFVANTKERTFRKYKDSLKYFNNQVQRSCEGWQAAIASQEATINTLNAAITEDKILAEINAKLQGEIEELKAQLAESEWVSVKDRLPDEYQQVLIFTNKKTFELDRLIKDYGWEATNDIVKYWIAINAPTENT